MATAEQKLRAQWAAGRQSMSMDAQPKRAAEKSTRTIADLTPAEAKSLITGSVFIGALRACMVVAIVQILLAVLLFL